MLVVVWLRTSVIREKKRMLQHPLRLKHPDVLRNVTKLRNDRILNRYKIMKKSGKSGGKGIIPLPPGRFFLLTLLFTLLAAAGVRAQNPPVSINAKAITINELFTRIEKQGVYTFAYNNADIDLKRIVTGKQTHQFFIFHGQMPPKAFENMD